MDRITIIDCGGKSHLARELDRLLDIPATHLDAHYYDTDWTPLPKDEFAALQRELAEELGATARIIGFAGAVEHTYTDDGTDHRELNLVFAVELADTAAAISHEDHLDFTPVPIAELAGTDLRPRSLRDALLARAGDRVPFWRGRPASGIEPGNKP